MKRLPSTLAAAAALCLVGASQAAIAPGSSGNGELFLNVYDATARVSFTLDLGLRMDDFFVQGQLDGGSQTFWALDRSTDARFDAFLALATASTTANLRWSVVAIDNFGPASAGDTRLFTTVKQGDEAKITTTDNGKFSAGLAETNAGQFFPTINGVNIFNAGQSTHADSVLAASNYAVNGSSYSRTADSGFGYYGKSGGLTHNLNNNTKFSAGNLVGNSSWFYYITRSSDDDLGLLQFDEFDNGDGVNAGSGHDGYWGFTLVGADTTSPYFGQYLLSYTLEPRVWSFVAANSVQAAFAASIGRTEVSAGFWVARLDGAAAAASFENSAGWVSRLGAAGGTNVLDASLVPEPASAWLLLVGGGLLLARRHRRAAG